MKTVNLILSWVIIALFVLGSCSKDSSNNDDGPTNPIEESPSRIETVTIQSPALGIEKSFNIYLPKGYDESTESYPAVYLFRGHENEWAQHGIKDRADGIINSGKMGKIIFIFFNRIFFSNCPCDTLDTNGWLLILSCCTSLFGMSR